MGKDAFTSDQARTGDVLAFIDQWRADTKRQNAQRKILRQSPRRLAMSLGHHGLQLVRNDAPNIMTDFLSTKRRNGFAEPRWLAVADVERVCQAFSTHEGDATGWFMDSDVADAALQFTAVFMAADGKQDVLTLLLPTIISNGMHYAQCCKDL